MPLPSFVVLTPPRCRSAWLSTWLTDDRVVAFHDPARWMTDPPRIASALGGLAKDRRVGVVDTSLILWWRELFAEIDEDVPVAYVTRHPEASALSLSAHFGVNYDEALAMTQTMWFEFTKAMQARPGPHVTFSELSDPATLQMLWKHLRGEDAFPVERTALLTTMNVQHDDEDMRKGMTREFSIAVTTRLKELGIGDSR